VIFERGDGGDAEEGLALGRSGAFLQGVGRLDELPPARIELSDAVLFEAGRLDGDFYKKLSATGGETVRFAPAPLRARGTELLLVVHPWEQVGEPVSLRAAPRDARRSRLEARLPDDVRPGEVLSLEIILPHRWRPNSLRQVQVHGQPVHWDVGGAYHGRRRLVSRRFQVADPADPIVFVLSRPLPGRSDFRVHFRRWER
jgi:hypothetical protein